MILRNTCASGGWTLNFGDGKPESDKPFKGQRGVAFYSPKLKKVVSMDIKDKFYFTKDGSIVNTSKVSMDEKYEKYKKKEAKSKTP